MEKLELKNLVGYLPYGLKGISKEENLGIEEVKGFSIYGKHNTVCLSTNVDDIDLELFKPILRPLSDLTKEIEHNGEKFVPINILGCDKDLDFYLDGDSSYFSIYNCLCDLEKLYEWHFDIHGLIEKGLAIDINTLE